MTDVYTKIHTLVKSPWTNSDDFLKFWVDILLARTCIKQVPQSIYSKTCPYRNALGTQFYSGLDRFRFRQGFCFWRGTKNDNLYN